MNLKRKLAQLPTNSGVYLFKGAGQETLYVGKARSLRNRVRSYFQNVRETNPRFDRLVECIQDVVVIVTDTEREAFVLENSLIKTHKPRFNVLLRDDKNHPYLKLTIDEGYPRLYIVRQPGSDGAVYSGPYVPASLARKTANLVHRFFGIRNCREKLTGKRSRPCLQYQIKRCVAPCVDEIISLAKYRKVSEDAKLFLEGKSEALISSVKAKMQEAANSEHFEEAAKLRDNLRMLEDLATRQKMASVRADENDVFGLYREGDKAVLQVFSVRSGKVVDRDSFVLEKLNQLELDSEADLIQACLKQYYELGRFLPNSIHVPREFSDRSAVAEWLTSKKGSKVEIKVPMKGSKRRLLDLVGRNAKLSYELDHREEVLGTSIRLNSLQSVLNLAERPERIEGFDVSNIQGREAVASMVVFELGQPKRSDYRKYKIKSLPSNQIDDFASIREVVYRRYRRVLEEGFQLPDLIVVDGGKGQIGSALQALEELGLSYLPIIALAKKEELIFLPERTDPIKLDQYSPARQLLQHVRDEAHRFAVSFHRKLRKDRDFSSPLEAIYGVGPRKRQKLLTQFGSIKGVRSATLEQLKNSLGAKLGQRVYLHIAEKL